jgi:hypothetical protein
MENCFDLLDLSPTATLAEVKANYELLMKIYRPERFANVLDKEYAKHKCAELTRAYRTLAGVEHLPSSEPSAEPATPRVEPSLIDWGGVKQGERLATHVYIYSTGEIQRLILTPNTPDWLRVGRLETGQVAGKAVLGFEVMVNTRQLAIGKRYVSQIQVDIDGQSFQVSLLLKIDPPDPTKHRWLQASETHNCRLRRLVMPLPPTA